ncbi:protein CyaE [Nitrospira sp.]|nr:protein CyaE [Nitrospira sp.]
MLFNSAASITAHPPELPPSPLTIVQAVQFGIDHFPAVRASLARVAAAQSGIDLTRTAYLPRLDMGFQASRATFNNVSGLFFPNAFTQPISGPDLGTRSYSTAWGSIAGATAGWEPFDFGLRARNVETARATERQAAAGAALTQLDVGLGVGDGFFTVAMASQTVEAMKGNLERRRVFKNTVEVLVASGLRPGVDLSRSQAELALAQTQLIQAEQSEEIARATLAEVLGVAGTSIAIQSAPLLTLPAVSSLPEPAPWTHPQAIAQLATADIFRKRQEALDRAWAPRFNLQAALFGRGSGWDNQGNREAGGSGLSPDVPNVAAGLTMTFALFDFATIRAQRSIERHHEHAERATYDQVIQALTGKHAKAVATVRAALKVAENTPVQLSAARDTELQARTRYKTGLATVLEVAEAQQLLVQATIDDALARLGLWRALLGLAGARGDLRPFLELAVGSQEKGP